MSKKIVVITILLIITGVLSILLAFATISWANEVI